METRSVRRRSASGSGKTSIGASKRETRRFSPCASLDCHFPDWDKVTGNPVIDTTSLLMGGQSFARHDIRPPASGSYRRCRRESSCRAFLDTPFPQNGPTSYLVPAKKGALATRASSWSPCLSEFPL